MDFFFNEERKSGASFCGTTTLSDRVEVIYAAFNANYGEKPNLVCAHVLKNANSNSKETSGSSDGLLWTIKGSEIMGPIHPGKYFEGDKVASFNRNMWSPGTTS